MDARSVQCSALAVQPLCAFVGDVTMSRQCPFDSRQGIETSLNSSKDQKVGMLVRGLPHSSDRSHERSLDDAPATVNFAALSSTPAARWSATVGESLGDQGLGEPLGGPGPGDASETIDADQGRVTSDARHGRHRRQHAPAGDRSGRRGVREAVTPPTANRQGLRQGAKGARGESTGARADHAHARPDCGDEGGRLQLASDLRPNEVRRTRY
jgi:hypothetical protein